MLPTHYWILIAFLHPLFKNQITQNHSALQAEVYARFSPLIGGPPFLPPLHVEVLIYNEKQSNEDHDHSIILHRIDYLPKNPTDPNTILNLLMLKHVPGDVRHRIYLSSECRRTTMEQTAEDWNMVDDSQTSIILVHKERIQSILQDSTIPLLSITTSTDNTFMEDEFLSKLAPSLKELLLEKKQRDLHLLHHNCYSFAYDVYTCIKKQTLI